MREVRNKQLFNHADSLVDTPCNVNVEAERFHEIDHTNYNIVINYIKTTSQNSV